MVARVRVDATTNEHEAALRRLGLLPPLGGVAVHLWRGPGGPSVAATRELAARPRKALDLLRHPAPTSA